jgi:hypothetical protein
MTLRGPDHERQKLLRFLRRTGVYSGIWGTVLCAFGATRLFTDALIDTQFAIAIGIVGGISLVAWASLQQTARDLEHMAAASQVREEPTKQEVRGWVLKWAGAELLVFLGLGALGFVMFGFVGAIIGSGAAAVLFGSIWIRTIWQISAYRRSRGNA